MIKNRDQDTYYDYENQAWIQGGRYVRCGHPESMNCRCYGRLHEGEIVELKEEG